jgi:hypothetical protein
MSVQKGTIIVNDGAGKIVGISPGNDDEMLVFDSTQPFGLKYVTNPGQQKKIFKLNQAKNTSTKNATYTTMYSFSYPGSDITTLDKVSCMSSMDVGVTSYDVRLFDITNSQVIFSINLNHTVQVVSSISTFNNLPSTDAVFEVQARKNGGSGNQNIYVDDITVIYI